MADIDRIRRLYFEKGQSYAQITRETGFDVKTIKKHISQDDFNFPEPEPKKSRASKLDPFKKDIDAWLTKDLEERKKQRHTARRVFNRLQKEKEDAFDCSYRLVAKYVAWKKAELTGESRVYLPLVHPPGEAQLDFGEADFIENGTRYNGHYLNMSFPYSNAGFVQLFKGENQQCLMEGAKNIWAFIGGVCHHLWLDNPSTAVVHVKKNGERIMTEHFLRFVNHYGFGPNFCNVGQAHEKGSVENKVGYHRRNLLAPPPEFEDLQEFNRQLLEECRADMDRPHYQKGALIRDLFAEDLAHLRPLPQVEFDEAALVPVRTNSYAKFTLGGGKHTYSTRPRYARSSLWARLTAHQVVVLDENYREVIRHPRLYGGQKESMDWLPYLTQLSHRPRALKYTGIYQLLPPRVQEFLEEVSSEHLQETLRMLAAITEESGFDRALEALEVALEHGASDAESILATASRQGSKALELTPVKLPLKVPELPALPVNIRDYDRRFLEGGGSPDHPGEDS